jgi:hypothetical protein
MPNNKKSEPENKNEKEVRRGFIHGFAGFPCRLESPEYKRGYNQGAEMARVSKTSLHYRSPQDAQDLEILIAAIKDLDEENSKKEK